MSNIPILMPQPVTFQAHAGEYTFSATKHLILLKNDPAAPFLFSAQNIQHALLKYAQVTASPVGGDQPATIQLIKAEGFKPESYQLDIDAHGVHIQASDAAGIFYGAQTFKQLLRQYGATLPYLHIEDAPDFPTRGVMLDVSRDRVLTMPALLDLIDRLAEWKINHLELYFEHTFAYRNHEKVWKESSPFTAEEILMLDQYCQERFIELVPNQNSFGHLHKWFQHPEYLHLAETEMGIETPWGHKFDYPFSLSPAVPEVYPFIEELFDELLPNFTSRKFNVGADETFDLGKGKTQDVVEKYGKSRVYADFLLQLYNRVKARGRTMLVWGDIMSADPEIILDLPKDVIALEWWYEDTNQYMEKTARYKEAGVPFYVCPGTSSWTSLSGRTQNCITNIRTAVESGLENGAIGVLTTDWGDNGHWQQYPVRYLGLAYGASLSWSYEANLNIDLPTVLDVHVFEDAARVMGKLVYDLGNTYLKPGFEIFNGNVLYWAYRYSAEAIQKLREGTMWTKAIHVEGVLQNPELFRKTLEDTIAYIETVIAPLNTSQMAREDASLLKQEFRFTADLLTHGAKRLLYMLDQSTYEGADLKAELQAILEEYKALWLQRSRPGGLAQSLKYFEPAFEAYQ